MKKWIAPLLGIGFASALSACAVPPAPQASLTPVVPAVKPVAAPAPAAAQIAVAVPAAEDVASAPASTGIASWYRTGRRLHRTYSGALLNNNAFTAASSVLPMGTEVRVDRLDGSGSVVVMVNDRMPRNHRLIDLSEIAAKELGLMGCGVASVTVTPIEVASVP